MSKHEEFKEILLKQAKQEYPDNPYVDLAVERAVDSKSDECFKYILTRSSHIRNIMCSHILPGDIKLKETTVVDSHLYKQNVHDKPGIVDIAAIDDLGNNYNIEMQCYKIIPSDFKRFQYYAYKSIGNQLDMKDDYMKLNPIYQLIINGSGKDAGNLNHFEHHFEIYDKHYKTSLPHSLYYTNYIQLHHKDEIDNKEKLNDFLGLMLIFQDKRNTDIIDSEVVKEFEMLYEDYIKSANAINAVRDEINRMYWDVRMEETNEESKEAGYLQGKEEEKINSIKAIMNNFNYNLDQAMEALNLDLSQKEKYKQLLDM